MRIAITVLILSLIFTASGPAQQSFTRDGGNKVTLVKENKTALLSTFNVEFKDATLGEAFALIEKALGNKLNVIVDPSAKGLRLPEISLQNINVLMISELIRDLVIYMDVSVYIRGDEMSVEDLLYEYYGMLEEMRNNDGAEEEDFIFFNPDNSTPILKVTQHSEDRDFRIIPVNQIFDDYGVDLAQISDVATAIETAWEMMPDNYSANLKYHKETQLLICSGTENHLELVDDVVRKICGVESVISSDTATLKKLQGDVGKVQAEMKGLKSTINALADAIQDLANEIKELKKIQFKKPPR